MREVFSEVFPEMILFVGKNPETSRVGPDREKFQLETSGRFSFEAWTGLWLDQARVVFCTRKGEKVVFTKSLYSTGARGDTKSHVRSSL